VRDSADSYDPSFGRVRKANSKRQRNRFDDGETFAKRDRHVRRLATVESAADATDGLAEGERWSTWDQSTPTERGPRPHPRWLVTDLAAIDTELGIVKTGKEADVFLIRRAVPNRAAPIADGPAELGGPDAPGSPDGPGGSGGPGAPGGSGAQGGSGGGRSCLLAAKRYRDPEHRLFHRDAGYLEGRRTRDSRVTRAAANRTAFGREAIAGMWASAEFAALCLLHESKVPVPYPVQITGTEVLLEFIGDPDGTAAPRLAETRPDDGELADLWDQLVEAMLALARRGYAHGDLSPYNLLVYSGRLVMIDLPQVVDVIAHPNGRGFLERDAANVAKWFAARGLSAADPEKLAGLLAEQARLALRDVAALHDVLLVSSRGHKGGKRPREACQTTFCFTVSLPLRMVPSRCARRATEVSWVTMTMDNPLSCQSFSSRPMISSRVSSSRLPVGSSASSTFGSFTSARAIATRCCWPPESSDGRWRARSARPTEASASAARALRDSPLIPSGTSAVSTFS
jgi:RIO kinase 1